MNNHQLNALEALDSRLQQSFKALEQAYYELQVTWITLQESYEGQGSEEADIHFQALAGQIIEYQHTLEKLMMQCSREIAEVKERGEAHAT